MIYHHYNIYKLCPHPQISIIVGWTISCQLFPQGYALPSEPCADIEYIE